MSYIKLIDNKGAKLTNPFNFGRIPQKGEEIVHGGEVYRVGETPVRSAVEPTIVGSKFVASVTVEKLDQKPAGDAGKQGGGKGKPKETAPRETLQG